MPKLLSLALFAAACLPAASLADEPCPKGNLLAKKRVYRSTSAKYTARITDGKASTEGGNWKTSATALLEGGEASVTYDLGRQTHISALMLQGDNNDTYQISSSVDGHTFTPLWTVPKYPLTGMRTRLAQGLDARARYLRIHDPKGDNAFSVGEFQAFCAQPAVWPPPVEAVDGKIKPDKRKARLRRMARRKIAGAVLGLIALLGLLIPPRLLGTRPALAAVTPVAAGLMLSFAGWAGWSWTGGLVGLAMASVLGGGLWGLAQRGRPWRRLAERGSMIVVVLVSGIGWVNWGTFHGGRAIHYHEMFHYYMGAKYAEEIGYTLLYNCTVVAHGEEGYAKEMKGRKVRVLKNNLLLPSGKAILDNPRECKDHFTPERWEAFVQDVRLFRSQMGAQGIKKVFTDHGYNATPVWNMVGHYLSNRDWRSHVPPAELAWSRPAYKKKSAKARAAITARWTADKLAFQGRIRSLARIDAALYSGLFLLIAWAFGLRAMAMAVLLLYVGHPWSYFWTGGGFARLPWLFFATAGICLLKKGRPALAGFSLTWSMLCRIFPGALIAGITAKIGWGVIRRRRISRTHLLFMGGCAAALVLLVGLPLVTPNSGGDHYKTFLANSLKHKKTGLTNHMGLPTLFTYHPKYVGREIRKQNASDPWGIWKVKRHQILKARRIPFTLTVIALFLLLAYVSWYSEDWEGTALSTIMIIAIFQLTCYYYIFAVLLAPVAVRRARYAVALVGMALATQLIHLDGGWIDEIYLKESAVVMATYLYILVGRALEIRDANRAERLAELEAPPPDERPAPDEQPAPAT